MDAIRAALVDVHAIPGSQTLAAMIRLLSAMESHYQDAMLACPPDAVMEHRHYALQARQLRLALEKPDLHHPTI